MIEFTKDSINTVFVKIIDTCPGKLFRIYYCIGVQMLYPHYVNLFQ